MSNQWFQSPRLSESLKKSLARKQEAESYEKAYQFEHNAADNNNFPDHYNFQNHEMTISPNPMDSFIRFPTISPLKLTPNNDDRPMIDQIIVFSQEDERQGQIELRQDENAILSTKMPSSNFHYFQERQDDENQNDFDDKQFQIEQPEDIMFPKGNGQMRVITTPKRQFSSMQYIQKKQQIHTTGGKSSKKTIPQMELVITRKKNRPKDKGLRVLSQRAYDIIVKHGKQTYKEVAKNLVDQINSNTNHPIQNEAKDQQNIKRRVYDALNVLIALGVLDKTGRKIDVPSFDKCKKIKRDQQLQHAQLQNVIELKERVIRQKLNTLQQAETRRKAAKYMVAKNQRQNESNSKRIRFPFIVIVASFRSFHVEQQLFMSELPMHEWTRPYGDIDIMMKLYCLYEMAKEEAKKSQGKMKKLQ